MLESALHLEAERDQSGALLDVLADALAPVDPEALEPGALVALGVAAEPLRTPWCWTIALHENRYHTQRMGTLVQIRDVPEPIHRKLKARAADRGTSLSEYLRQELERIAATPTNQELRERLARREPVHLSETPAEAIRAIRDHGE